MLNGCTRREPMVGMSRGLWMWVAAVLLVPSLCGYSRVAEAASAKRMPRTGASHGRAAKRAARPSHSSARRHSLAKSSKKAAVKATFLIVPGRSLGPIRLGMSAKDATAAGRRAWGESPEVDTTLGTVIHWKRSDVAAFIITTGAGVWKIATTNGKFRTSGGIGPGTPFQKAKKELGKPRTYEEFPGIGASASWSGLTTNILPSGAVADVQILSRGASK